MKFYLLVLTEPTYQQISIILHAGVEGLIGGTFALDSKGTHTIKPMLNFTVNRFNFDNDRTYGNNALPAAPDYFLKGEALYHHASGYFLGPTFDVAGQRWGDYANTYKIGSYGLLGMRTGWSNEHYKCVSRRPKLVGYQIRCQP
jgi:iron complex outermembrane receptor protein